jgi:flagellar biosynthesis protein
MSETTDKQKKAVALKYGEEDAVPKVSAKGKGWLAEKIIEIAKEHDLPIRTDADLVEILEKVELDQEIPLEVYAVVAEIFAYIYRVNQQKKNSV